MSVATARSVLHIYSRRLQQGSHYRAFSVDMTTGVGWQVRDERDSELIRQHVYDDWHRVEVAMSLFSMEAAQLARNGWCDA